MNKTIEGDLDDVKSNGFYFAASGASNSPVPYFHFITFKNTDSGFIIQMGSGKEGSPKLYRRDFDGSSWSVWKTVTFE